MTKILLLLSVLLLPLSGHSEVINASITSMAELPTGTIKQEPVFGAARIFSANFTTDTITPRAANPFDLKNFSTVDDLRRLLESGFQQQDFLDVDQAFKLRIQAIQENKIRAVFEIADGYYLYRDKITFSNDGENRIGRVVLPAGTVKQDEYFGEVTVFNNNFSFPVELISPNDLNDGLNDDLTIHANYQGCAEDGICYAPVNKSFDISDFNIIPVAQAGHQTVAELNTALSKDQAASSEVAESVSREDAGKYTDSASSFEALLPLLLGAFFAGILLTFTPCVLPMIPILFSIIAGQGNHLTKTQGGMLAATYVLGTAVTYAGMGALAGASGDQLQAYFQNIWAIGALSALFFVMALSMFGLFEIRMPEFIQSKVQATTQSNIKGMNIKSMTGSIPLVFLLGLASALIIGACVSPVLISFLGIAVSKGDPLLGAQLMMVMAIGMGLPLIALGFGAGHFIPRSGKWMVKVKQGFGVMLIAVAIYLLGILPQVPILLLWGGFFIILSLFLGTAGKTPEQNSNWLRIEKGLGIILLVWGILLIAGGLLGQRDILRPLPPNLLYSITGATKLDTQSTAHQFVRVSNNDELEQQLARAHAQNKLVLIDYYADWCVDCIRMEKTTFAHPQVRAVLDKKFITVQIDVTDPQDSDSRALKQRFDVFGPPATLFIDRDGRLLKQKNFYGYMESDAFLSLITEL